MATLSLLTSGILIMLRTMFSTTLALLIIFTSQGPLPGADEPPTSVAYPWRAGTAAVVITPPGPIWMAGYAARKEPSDGTLHDLHAKALALEDAGGNRLVIVTCDLIGIPRTVRDKLVSAVQEKYLLNESSLLLNASHTHCGPELRPEKAQLYGIPAGQVKLIEGYVARLQEQLLQLVGESLDQLAPAQLSYTHGRAGFAMNRRRPTPEGIQNRPYADGPVDHDVPVLRVTAPDGSLRAILFGYACHNTTLGIQKICGDYAGFAQYYLEEAHPGVQAMFMAGCGGDENPQPRRTVELAEQHGRALANGVEAALISTPMPLQGPLACTTLQVKLPFADPPTREQLEKLKESGNFYDQRHAEVLLEQLKRDGSLMDAYPYLVQAACFGDGVGEDHLVMIALAGEVVVDYSLRFKSTGGLESPTWVAGYSNDVFGYVPSLRVLQEGGYEGGGAMRYTTLPGPFATDIEHRIVEAVFQAVTSCRSLALARMLKKDKPLPFLASPCTEKKLFTTGIEGPACDKRGFVYAVNFKQQGTIGRIRPSGEASLFVTLPEGSIGNGIRFDRKGMMYVADYTQHNVLKINPRSGKVSVHAHNEKMNQPNDLAIDGNGVLYASDPNWGNGTGQLWRIDRDGSTTLLTKEMGTTNGIEVSPDNKTLYVNESVQRNVWAFPIQDDGSLGEKRLIRQFPDHGFDGMRCDVDGNLYITRHGKGTVVKMQPDGKILVEIDVLGTSPTNLCFGGPDGRTVYVTEVQHQRLVKFHVDRPGLAWQRWRE